MEIKSKYTKVFTSNDLTKKKYDDIQTLALELLEHKREVSLEVASNLFFYNNLDKYSFISHLVDKYKDIDISSNFYVALYKDIYTTYSNKFDAIKKKMSFKVNRIENKQYYKRDSIKTKGKKNGIRKIYYKKVSTNLGKALTYLAKYPLEDILAHLSNKVNEPKLDIKKKEFFESIIYYITKYGYERIINLANLKRLNLLNRYSDPVEFKSLNFKGRTRTKSLISYNLNNKSIKKAFITLSWTTRGKKMIIPVKYSKDFYGDIENYQKTSNDYEYVLTFTSNGKINISFCIDGVRDIPVNKGDVDKFVGVDVNVKNNLFTLSDETTYDYDRELLEKICIELDEIDNLKGVYEDKNNGKKYKLGKRRKRKLNSLRNNLKHSMERLISAMCKDMVEKGYNHAIFEDLNNSFGRNHGLMNDINFNRVVKELKLSSLKDMFERIARKHDIAFSKVQPEYTSKMCSQCCCIDDDNRTSQESFLCVECGYKNNADVNAALNIKNRVVKTVFSNLLNQNEDFKTYTPRKITRLSVRTILESSLPDKELSPH